MNRASMKQDKLRFMSVILAVVVLLSLGLAGAVPAEAAGTGVSDALTPTGDWEQLNAGQSRWYAFEYAGDGSQVEVRLELMPEGSASFVVWTPEEIYRWGLGESVQPVGRSAADPHASGVLVWSGSFTTAGTYYVVLEHAANSAGTSYYLLDVSGTGVSFRASAPASTPSTTSTAKTVTSQPRSALGHHQC
jgi:hypothetical protein